MFCTLGGLFVLIFPIQNVGVKTGEGHQAACGIAKQIILRRGEELDSGEGTFLAGFCLPQSAESFTPGLLPVGVKPLLPIHFNA